MVSIDESCLVCFLCDGFLNVICVSASVCFVCMICCVIVVFDVRYARAIFFVVRLPSSCSVSVIWVLVESKGW